MATSQLPVAATAGVAKAVRARESADTINLREYRAGADEERTSAAMGKSSRFFRQDETVSHGGVLATHGAGGRYIMHWRRGKGHKWAFHALRKVTRPACAAPTGLDL
jgi:hypothetical protein